MAWSNWLNRMRYLARRYIRETSSVLQFLNHLHLALESIFPSFLLNIIVSDKMVNEDFAMQQKCNIAMPLPRHNRDMMNSTSIHRLVRCPTNHILPQRVMRANNWFSLLLLTTAFSSPILYGYGYCN
ncbi:hypothetical protein ACTXT7_011772 [Hymenolepis weldensis]